MIKSKNVKFIEVSDWDELVQQTYGRTYNFQQQDNCKERGIHKFSVPLKYGVTDYKNDTVPEIVNHSEIGVSFKAWLERDPKQKLSNEEDQDEWCLDLWWERNFYPHVDTIINDLYQKGLIEEGDYTINIDW